MCVRGSQACLRETRAEIAKVDREKARRVGISDAGKWGTGKLVANVLMHELVLRDARVQLDSQSNICNFADGVLVRAARTRISHSM